MRSESSGSNFRWSSIIDGCLLLTVNIYFKDDSILFQVIPNNFSCLNLKRPPSRITSLVTCGASEPAEKWHVTSLCSRYGKQVAKQLLVIRVVFLSYINCPFTYGLVVLRTKFGTCFLKAICEHRQQILVGSHFTNDEYVWNTWESTRLSWANAWLYGIWLDSEIIENNRRYRH